MNEPNMFHVRIFWPTLCFSDVGFVPWAGFSLVSRSGRQLPVYIRLVTTMWPILSTAGI